MVATYINIGAYWTYIELASLASEASPTWVGQLLVYTSFFSIDQGEIKERLAEAISLLPDFMRNANTTFVNLRAALDDVGEAPDGHTTPVHVVAQIGRPSTQVVA